MAFFDRSGVTAPVLRTASRTGVPTARVVVASSLHGQHAHARSGNVSASIAELALVLRLGMIRSSP